MWPVLLTWRGHVLHSYPVVIYAASLLTLLVTAQLARFGGFDPDAAALATFFAYIPAFMAARLFYVARHWRQFRNDRWRILQRSAGGLSLFGGILGLFAGLVPLLAAFRLPIAPFFDALVPAMIAGIAVAKGGCALNGCCHGHETAHWCGIRMPDEKGIWRRRFPAPFIEMAWALVVFLLALGVLTMWRAPPPKAGLLACGALALHAAGRMALQNLRDEGAEEDRSARKNGLILIVAALAAAIIIGL